MRPTKSERPRGQERRSSKTPAARRGVTDGVQRRATVRRGSKVDALSRRLARLLGPHRTMQISRAAWTATAPPGTARQNRCGHESAIGPSFTYSHDKVRPTNKRTQTFTRLLLRQGFKAWSSTIILSKVKAWSSTIILAIPATISKNSKTYIIQKTFSSIKNKNLKRKWIASTISPDGADLKTYIFYLLYLAIFKNLFRAYLSYRHANVRIL